MSGVIVGISGGNFESTAPLNEYAITVVEKRRLEKTLAIAQKQLEQAQNAAKVKEEEIVEAKKDVRENASYGMTNLYSSDDFEALVELSQCMNPVRESEANYEEEKQKILRLEKIMKTPYFARIDFQFEDEDEAEEVYIGRASLTEKESRKMYVYDWRSPIASVFYRFMNGKAFYNAPCGKVEGEVKLKRQFEIENGILEYFFDTDRNISDEFLRQMLSKNTSPQMKAIVETIQGEQDVAIRDMENDLLMVQGVAGSGKTSIALHRAAYLMYQGLQAKLSAENILIVSPNATFAQYISNVLPELGEENIASVVFEDVMDTVLRDKRIQSKNEFLESAVTNSSYKDVVKGSIEFKTSKQFEEILKGLLEDIPLRWIAFHDICYDGKCVITRQALREWVLRRTEIPLGARLEQLEEYVLELIFGTVKRRKDAEERNRIKQEIQQFTRFDIVKIYKKLFYDKGYLNKLSQGIENGEMLGKIRRYTCENLESGCLHYDDAIEITYLYLKIYGTNKYRNIKQVVIDEAQDYYPLQYEIFRQLFLNAKFTVLGDVNQTLAKQEDLSFYEQVRGILNRKNASLITLDKSFRCTNEILQFSLQFMEHKPVIESFNRKGELPAITETATHEELCDAVVREVNVCRERGYKTICLICKTRKNAVRLFDSLKSKIEIQLIQDKKIENLEGIFIMPVYMSKGLEFDAVLLCDADTQNYCDEDDRKLLYVECTRALHRLNLFCEGESSLLITDKNLQR